jgi:uncharacterized protein
MRRLLHRAVYLQPHPRHAPWQTCGCVQLTADLRCAIFGHPDRPAVCSSLQPSEDMCGDSREQAMRWLGGMEAITAPGVAVQKRV